MDQSENKEKNIVYLVGSSKFRDGVPQDVEKIKKTFEQLYNCDIYNKMDNTPDDYKKFFCNLKNDPCWLEKFSRCKFVSVICMAHGTTEGLIKSKNDLMNLKGNFLNPLFNIKQLDGKLKWLIVQSCRGKLDNFFLKPDGIPRDKFLNYFMVSYCTSEGAPSYQWGTEGKIFIQYLCDELAKNAKQNYEESLVSIMIAVNSKIKQYGTDENFAYFPRSEFLRNFDDTYRLKADFFG